jgi:hypothetical protein
MKEGPIAVAVILGEQDVDRGLLRFNLPLLLEAAHQPRRL